MAVALSPIGGAGAQFFDNNGNPLSGGKLYTYEAGTTTPAVTYTTLAGTTPHTNPIILDSAGRVPGGEIWLTLPDFYKFVLKTPADVTLGTWDNIQGYSSGSVAYAATEVQIATAGQTLFVLTEMFYNPGTNTLAVYIDGVNQVVNNSYVESTSTSVTFMSGLHVGAVVKFVNVNVASADASAVTYEPGFVGSVATTVAAKLQQTVSVKDFGAVGDGVADDAAAIQAAIDAVQAAGGGEVFFPEGEFLVSSATIDITDNNGVPLVLRGSGNGPFVNGSTTIASKSRIILANGNAATYNRVGIDFSGSSNWSVENLSITSQSGAAPDIGVLMQRINTTGGAYCNYSKWRNVNITVSSDPTANGGLGSIAIAFKRAEQHSFYDCVFVADLPMLQDGSSGYPSVVSQYYPEYVFSGATQSMTYFRNCTFYPLSSVCFNIRTVFACHFDGGYFPTYANGGASPQGVGVIYASRDVKVNGQIEQWGSTHATSVSRDLFYVTENSWDIDVDCTCNLTSQVVFKTNSKNVYGLKLRCQGASNTMLATSGGAVYGGRVEYESGDSQSIGSQYGGVEVIDTTTGNRTYRSSVGGTLLPSRFTFSQGLVTTSTTVAALPVASASTGARCFVSDANATTFASIVVGGGSNGVPVYSDGTNWRIG